MKELEWNSDLERVEICFSYDKKLVDLVRELPGRLWHPEAKRWSIPRESLPEVAHRLIPLGFAPSAVVRAMLDDPDAPLPARAADPLSAASSQVADSKVADAPVGGARRGGGGAASDPPGDTWSISRLNERVRGILRDRIPGAFWVVGEVVGFDRNSHKQHVFFTLAEKEEGDDAARATVTAVLFGGTRSKVDQTLAKAGGGLAFQDGVRVRLEVSVDFYPRTGSFQLIVSRIDPTFTLGEIALRQERILRQVREAGLAEKNLALPFPLPALRIGLVTSQGSDAYNDFLSELRRSSYAFEVSAVDVHVQGARLEKEVLAALDHFANRRAEIDVVVITRGGGSRTDLMGFDTPDLAFAVARHPNKIIIGIGHQQDRSVLDAIAHSEKTPTAAAARLVSLCREAEDRLRRAAERLSHGLARTLHRESSRTRIWQERAVRGARGRFGEARGFLDRAARDVGGKGVRVLRGESDRLVERSNALPKRTSRRLLSAREQLRERGLRLSARLAARLVTARERLARDRDRLPRSAARSLERAGDRVRHAERELPRSAGRDLREAALRVAALAERVAARDPQAVLSRGYAWLRTRDGKTVASVAGVAPGDAIVAQVADGSIAARVEGVEPAPSDADSRGRPIDPSS